MTQEEHDLGKKLIFDTETGKRITEDASLAELLKGDLERGGVRVSKVGKRPRSKWKTIVFTIWVMKVPELDVFFLTSAEAQEWHMAKSRTLSSLTKAPNEAFKPLNLDLVEKEIYWHQAWTLAWRLGTLRDAKEGVLKKRGALSARNFGL